MVETKEKVEKEVKEVTDKDFYLIEQASQKLGVTVRYVRDAINDGELKGYKRGKRFYVLHTDLMEYVKSGKDAKEAQQNNPTKQNKPTNKPVNKPKTK
jgi:excisionase family DNA binding protein